MLRSTFPVCSGDTISGHTKSAEAPKGCSCLHSSLPSPPCGCRWVFLRHSCIWPGWQHFSCQQKHPLAVTLIPGYATLRPLHTMLGMPASSSQKSSHINCMNHFMSGWVTSTLKSPTTITSVFIIFPHAKCIHTKCSMSALGVLGDMYSAKILSCVCTPHTPPLLFLPSSSLSGSLRSVFVYTVKAH